MAAASLNTVLGFYVDTMRAIPLLVVLVWTFFAFPLLVGHSINAVDRRRSSALGIHLGAYVAETIRAGLTSVRPQPDAGGAGARHEPLRRRSAPSSCRRR